MDLFSLNTSLLLYGASEYTQESSSRKECEKIHTHTHACIHNYIMHKYKHSQKPNNCKNSCQTVELLLFVSSFTNFQSLRFDVCDFGTFYLCVVVFFFIVKMCQFAQCALNFSQRFYCLTSRVNRIVWVKPKSIFRQINAIKWVQICKRIICSTCKVKNHYMYTWMAQKKNTNTHKKRSQNEQSNANGSNKDWNLFASNLSEQEKQIFNENEVRSKWCIFIRNSENGMANLDFDDFPARPRKKKKKRSTYKAPSP